MDVECSYHHHKLNSVLTSSLGWKTGVGAVDGLIPEVDPMYDGYMGLIGWLLWAVSILYRNEMLYDCID